MTHVTSRFCIVLSIAALPYILAASESNHAICSKQFRGVLLHVKNAEDFSKGCHTTGQTAFKTKVLKKRAFLNLCKHVNCSGTKSYKKIDLDAIQTPILISPGSNSCISLREADNPAEFFCCENISCRDAWWQALTQNILCKHQVEQMRQEVAGEPTQEEEEELVLDKVVKKPEEGGINLHIDTGLFEKPPKLTVRTT